jgi:Glycosyltransferase family 87
VSAGPAEETIRRQLPVVPLIIGLIVRLVLAPFTAWNYDVAVWFHTALSGYYAVPLYERPGFSYPPVWGYILQMLGTALHITGSGPSFFGVIDNHYAAAVSVTSDFTDVVTAPGFNLAFKCALFTFDLLTAVVIYRFVHQLTGKPKQARLAFVAWFLNPFVIYESAIHGAFDVIAGFAVLATLVLILAGREYWAGAAWAIGIMTKLSPVTLGLELVLAIAVMENSIHRSTRLNVRRLARFGLGAGVAMAGLIAPLLFQGSVSAMLHNVFTRTQTPVTIGGISFSGVRYLRPFSGLLDWAFVNTGTVIQATTAAQVAAIALWAIWTVIMIRKDAVFALFTGAVGTLASFMLLSPVANPQYILWWLPALTVFVFASGRGYWPFTVISLAPVVFTLAILGPTASLAPLATYTHLIPASVINDQVIGWYIAPARLWGATLADDFFAPASLMTVAAIISLLGLWIRMAREEFS